MGSDLEQAPPPGALAEQITYAKYLAASNLLPKDLRDQPANLLLILGHAQALGIHPTAAIQGIAIINGKPTLSAQLMAGLARARGHKLRVEADNQTAIAKLIRADDPDYEHVFTFDMADAERAGLTSSTNWQKYPQAMLRARATSGIIRAACPEALAGITHTPDELEPGIIIDGDTGEVI